MNIHVKKEASYYGDMVLLPFMDEYNLVVLKTLAICEYAVRVLKLSSFCLSVNSALTMVAICKYVNLCVSIVNYGKF